MTAAAATKMVLDMKKYVSFCEKLNAVMLTCGIICLVFAIGLTFVQVVLRNLLDFSFTWAEELTRYVVIYAVYFASGSALYLDSNARVDILYSHFPKKVQCILSCLFYLLIAVFMVAMGYYGFLYVKGNLTIWCASIRIPWAVPFAALILGAANMLAQVPAKMYKSICELTTPV